MRITNKIISNNAVTNINNNKVYEDKINNQLSTGSKINRPSDDPVVAIRALRLRTNLNQVSQYYSKNIPDAESWLDVTESAVDTTVEIIKDMYANCTKGAAGFQTAEDRSKVLENIRALQKEVYATADVDYAGRYVFSGYRTDTPVTFGQATKAQYTITEQLTSDAIDEMTYVDVNGLDKMTEANAKGLGVTEQQVDDSKITRLRLAYQNCSNTTAPQITYYDAAGNLQSVTADIISINDTTQNPYLSVNTSASGVVYIPETGELLLTAGMADKLNNTIDDPNTAGINEAEIRITYQKNNFEASDIRPEHFFYCELHETDPVKTTVYNKEYLTGDQSDNAKQYISYDVGFNQSVRVNTLASELFSPTLGRDVDDLIHAIEDVDVMEKNVSILEKMQEADPDDADIAQRLDAAKKASTLRNDKMQKLFEKNITNMQGHLNKANNALTSVGNRSSRVELVSNRLAKQKVNFQELSSENEDIDLTEAAIELGSVELAYQAALMATGKISQTTLLNYI